MRKAVASNETKESVREAIAAVKKKRSQQFPTPRQMRLAKELPKAKNLKEALIKSGYAEESARSLPGGLAKRAVEAVQKIPATPGNKTTKELLYELGYTREALIQGFRYVAEQERDLSSKLRAMEKLAPILGSEDLGEKVSPSVPQFSITVEKTTPPEHREALPLPENGSI